MAPYGGQTSSSCGGLVAFGHQMGALGAPWLVKLKFGVLCAPPSSFLGGLVIFFRLKKKNIFWGVNFFFFFYVEKIENFWKCFAKISVTKFQKLKIGDDHLVSFSMFFVVVYFVFFCRSIFHGENCKTKSAILTEKSLF